MVIRQLYVSGDTIYAGTAVRSQTNINAGLYYSEDGGIYWSQLDTALGNGAIIDLEFLPENKDTFYMVKGISPYTSGGYLYKTTNRGCDWQIITELADKFINWFEISNLNRNLLYALEIIPFPTGSLELLHRSSDAGESWEDISNFPSDSHGNRVSVAMDELNEGFLYAAVGTSLLGDYFYKSSDKGVSWVYISEPPGISPDMFTDDYQADLIYLNSMYASYNGGFDWVRIDSGLVEDSNYLSFYQDIKSTSLLYNLRTDGIFISKRGDFLWVKLEDSEVLPLSYGIGGFSNFDVGLLSNIIINTNSNKLYVGTGYGIYKRDYITDVNHQSSEDLNDFRLEQNYPNPFNPSTTISYLIPERSFITIRVYNILGKEVRTLVEQEQTAGQYELVFESNNLPSGVYLYVLSATSENGLRIKEGKKMIIVK